MGLNCLSNNIKTVTNKGLNLIKGFEKLMLDRYLDQEGNPTIGWGHLITEEDGDLTRVTIDKATGLLHQDLLVTEAAVNKGVKVPITQNQFDAMVSWAYNFGASDFLKSKALKKLNKKDLAGAIWEFFDDPLCASVKIKGKYTISNGLTRRRKAEKDLFNGIA